MANLPDIVIKIEIVRMKKGLHQKVAEVEIQYLIKEGTPLKLQVKSKFIRSALQAQVKMDHLAMLGK